MDKAYAEKEIARLTELVAHHNRLYYQEGHSKISDYEFDLLLKQLADLEEAFPDLKLPHSPTQTVGGAPSKNFPTAYHRYPMLSLSNTYSSMEIEQFMQRVRRQLAAYPIAYFCELKFDGVAISLHYKSGQLEKIITRGDGTKGDDITKNGKKIPTIPHQLTKDYLADFLEVRGELILPLAAFEKINRERQQQGEELLANPRNTAAGMIKTINKQAALEELQFFAYSLASDTILLPTQEAGMNWLKKAGFLVSDFNKKCTTLQEVMAYAEHWQTAKNDLPLAIDGIVIKVNDLQQQQQLGATAKSPRWAIAYKYKPDKIATHLLKVDYQVGRTGVITPVAHLQPILLAGTVIKRATLHNALEIQRLDLHHDDTVFIEKGGEIIPKIIGVDLTKRNPTSSPITFTTTCPACDTPLIQKYEKSLLYCPNTDNCPYQLKGLFKHFVSRKAMDIQSLGQKTIELLIQNKLIKNLRDFYTLQYEDIIRLQGFQKVSAQRLLEGIEYSKKQPFDRVLFSLGIRHIGAVGAQKLAQHYGNIDQLIGAPYEELIQLPDIGPETARSLTDYFEIPENIKMIEELKKVGLQFKMPISPSTKKTQLPLTGETFLLSGTFENFERDAFKDFIIKNGGKIMNNISQKLDYLVAGKNPGPSKLEKAEKLAIPIIDETKVLKMLQE